MGEAEIEGCSKYFEINCMTDMDLVLRWRVKPRTEVRRAEAEEQIAGNAVRSKGKRERGGGYECVIDLSGTGQQDDPQHWLQT